MTQPTVFAGACRLMLSNRTARCTDRERAPALCEERVVRVALCGEFDLANCAEIVSQLDGVGDQHRQILVDLGAVTFMSACGITACLTAQQQARARGCDLRFTNAQGIVARVIEILEVDTLLLGDFRG